MITSTISQQARWLWHGLSNHDAVFGQPVCILAGLAEQTKQCLLARQPYFDGGTSKVGKG